ncbi:Membrane-anchored lipid-binding protein LAM5 [Meyerozyma sp. JA9]|nr:Membrane-anchored lipid-binding protein LAM5 [Meyerozyma sp. JA9]
MNDDDDAWSYSFPPSTETLPLPETNNNPEHESEEKSEKKPSKIDDIDHADADHDSKMNTDSDSGSSFEDKKKGPPIFTGSHTSSLSSLALQSPFMVKSSPADPYTTRQDANSVISNESANGLFERKDGAKGVDTLKREVLEKSMGNPVSKTRNSLDDSSSVASSSVTTSPPMSTTSPKIITYRKSKRTASEGNFQSILDAAAPKATFNPKLYVDEFLPDTNYRYTTIKRNTDFHQLFPSLDLTDRLLDDYACALSREILLQGRIYISEHYICFNSNLLGWVTNLVIPQEDIVSFEKKSTAGLFPNGIAIETKDAKHYFASFSSRDSTFEFMRTVWSKATGKDINSVTSEPEPHDDISEHVPSLLEISDTDDHPDSPSKFQSYILSIDGDDEKIDEGDEPEAEDVETEEKNEPAIEKVTVRRFKPDSKYINMGPEVHPRTTPDLDQIREPNETELCDETIDAPLGVVYDLAFGSNNTDFHTKFLRSHDASEISKYGDFHPMQEDPKKLQRHYTYRKALGFSIGPKSTMCEVSETIEHMNLAEYVSVVSRTVTPDVPSGNSFSVMTRYIFCWGENNTTKVYISFFIQWSGRSWIKSVIEKQSMATQITTTADYIAALKAEVEEQTVQSEQAAPAETIVDTGTAPSIPEQKQEPITSEVPTSVTSANQFILDNIVVVVSGLGIFLVLILVLQILLLFRVSETRKLAYAQVVASSRTSNWKTSSGMWKWLEKQQGKQLSQEQKLQYLLSEIGRLADGHEDL